MAKTPEGKIKDLTKSLLTANRYGAELYYNMPVPSGYGESMLDFVGCYRGRFFAIETKAPGKKPTPRQHGLMFRMEAAGAAVFVVDGPETLGEVETWLEWAREQPHGQTGAD